MKVLLLAGEYNSLQYVLCGRWSVFYLSLPVQYSRLKWSAIPDQGKINIVFYSCQRRCETTLIS